MFLCHRISKLVIPSMTLNLISDKIVVISLYMKEGVWKWKIMDYQH